MRPKRTTTSRRDESETLETLRARVSRELRQMVIAGELRPGERLLQQRLAERFGVSQSVMREALLEAQFSGLVVSSNGNGASVAAIDIAQVMKAYEVREMLEGLATRLCCQQASPAHLRELSELALKVHELGVANKDKERAQLDRYFHERIISICRNEVVARLSEGYHVVRLVVLKVTPHDQILADHMAIVDAMRAGDERTAEEAARRHVLSAREMIRRQLEDRHISFPWEQSTASRSVTAPGAAADKASSRKPDRP